MKPTCEKLGKRVKELEQDRDNRASEINFLRENIKKLKSSSTEVLPKMDNSIKVSGINIKWNSRMGTCSFGNLPVAMMWVDTTLAGLMSGVQSMVGTKRFGLALQSEGRKSVEDDWRIISKYSDFENGFKAIANIAAVAGWGDWKLISFDNKKKKCRFQVRRSWEGLYQKALGVCWGSAVLAGKMAGYCTKLFSTYCWADQTKFIAEGDPYDEFVVKPSDRSIENEIENLLATDEATRADMAVALQKLQKEVDERIRAEGALRESEEKYRLLIENIPSVTWVYNEHGKTTFISPNVERIYGFSQKEIYEKGEALWFDRIHPDDIEDVRKSFRRVFEEGMKVEVEYRIQRKDGEWIWINDTAIMAYEEDGVGYAYGVFSDITERKQAELKLRELTEMLEQRVAERTALAESRSRQLQALAIELIEAEERERRRVAGLLHDDLQQTLAAARMRLESVYQMQTDEPELPNVMNLLSESIEKSRRLSYELSPPVLQHSDLAAALQWTAKFFNEQFGLQIELKVQVLQQFENGPLKIFLFRAVQELLFNVVKHSEVKNACVELVRKDQSLILTVSDKGRGFDPEALDSPTAFSGLGLLSLRERARYIGGNLIIESTPGQGSSFTLTVPCRIAPEDEIHLFKAKPQPGEVAEILPGDGSGAIRVLFVDDHKVMRQGLINLIGGQPGIYVAGEASNGKEAIERVRQLKPEVVVMDVSMPEMDGIEATRRIKAQWPEVHVIALSMAEDEYVSRSMRDAGAEAFVSKAASSTELLKAIYRIAQYTQKQAGVSL